MAPHSGYPSTVCAGGYPSTPEKRKVDFGVRSPFAEDSLSCPSKLARFFASLQHLPSSEDRTQATLADVADSACRSLHQISQRHLPSASLLHEGLTPADRQETLVWLVQAFDVMHFSDSLLYDTALLLDRYYALPPREDIRSGESQRKLLAAVCMALKTGSNAETQLPLRQVVTHLGHDQVPFDDVMEAELVMLRKLKFDVGTPTALDFLEALGTRLGSLRISESCRSLAEFLLQLSLQDAPLHYRFPHAVLAASAFVLALYTSRAPSLAQTVILEDLSIYCPEALLTNGLLGQCCASLHNLWLRSASAAEQSLFSRHLCQKFQRVNFNSVSAISPPTSPPSIFSPVQSCGALSLATAPSPVTSVTRSQYSCQEPELDEAAHAVHESILRDNLKSYSTWDNSEEKLSTCPTCYQTWPLPEPHCGICPECKCQVEVPLNASNARDVPLWLSALASRLRPLADSSWKVRCVLVRYGWQQNRFRKLVDREQLLRDLRRASRGAGRSSAAMASAASAVASTTERIVLRDISNITRTSPKCQNQAFGDKKIRSASWCGQRGFSRTRSLPAKSP